MEWTFEKIYQQYMYSYPHKTAYQRVDYVQLENMEQCCSKQSMSLYFHVPFCESKCGYCNLFSISGSSKQFMDAYVQAVKRHGQQVLERMDKSSYQMDSLIFGGGTPMLLSLENLQTLFEIASDDFHINLGNTFSAIETSPNQTTDEKLLLLKANEVDRISIGVQSFIQEELGVLERCHTVSSAHRALERIKKYGFKNVNIDLIYGILGQDQQSLLESMKQALQYDPDEMFVYPLYNKPHTAIHGKFVIDQNKQYQLYFVARDKLLEAGYHQTSMRRFVKGKLEKPRSCGFENMLALGCGGRTYFNHMHFCEPYQIKAKACRQALENYIHKKDFFDHQSLYVLNDEEQKRRYVIKNLLHTVGIDMHGYREHFHASIMEDFPVLNDLIQREWAYVQGGFLRLSAVGISLSDAIGPIFISDEVRMKMERYHYDS